MSEAALSAALLASPVLAPLLDGWERVALPDAWLVAGAVAQSWWNHRFGPPPDHGISDLDLIYFDPSDLSEAAEADCAARLRAAFPRLPVRLDVKNEARVHLWYEAKFGFAIPPYRSAADAIASFHSTATAVGARPEGGGVEFCAPFGLEDLLAGVVRPNKRLVRREPFDAKAARWLRSWPGLRVIGWDEAP